ncbi:hypothetical protein ACIPSA_37515 [Streptomyces sp. NPDC086549]|uniref:hypothetical protein n=1 Tax=Streptomyces sp. NPDC086549 TaxID=3365752 RepID=UPI0038087040
MAGRTAARWHGLLRRCGRSLVRLWNWPGLRLILLALVVGLLAAQLWGVQLFRIWHLRGSPQFGDLSGWAQSVGAFGAIVVALAQSRRAQLGRLEDIRRREVDERTQVYGWVSFREDDRGRGLWEAFLNNLTRAPIGVWVLNILDETGRPVATVDVTDAQALAPGLTRCPTGVLPGAMARPLCELEFADSTGVCWRRDSTGRLAEIAEIRLGGQLLAVNPGMPADG